MSGRRAATLAIILGGGAFGGLAVAVASVPAVSRFDLAANAFFAPDRTELLIHALMWITATGASSAVLPVLVVASLLLWTGTAPPVLAGLWTSFIGTELSVWLVKYLMDRPRPEFTAGVTANSSSFPSTHAAATAAAYGFVAYLVVAHPRRSRAFKVAVATIAISS